MNVPIADVSTEQKPGREPGLMRRNWKERRNTLSGKRFWVLFLTLGSVGSVIGGERHARSGLQNRMEHAAHQAAPHAIPPSVSHSVPQSPRARKGRTVTTNVKIKELAAGNRSGVTESFVLVARDAQMYAALRALYGGLPEVEAKLFSSHAVIAAFLGQRRTSGYETAITRDSDGTIRIVEKSPSKDTMVKMVLTTPFKLVAFPLETDQPVVLALDTTWLRRLRPYRVTNGEVSITGGFAGVSKRLNLEGKVSVMRLGTLATFLFELRGTNGKQSRHFRDAASGSVDPSGRVTVPRIDAFALTGALESPFRATGQFTNNEENLTLRLETKPSPHVADNFAGAATLKAIATGPAPADMAITGKEPQ